MKKTLLILLIFSQALILGACDKKPAIEKEPFATNSLPTYIDDKYVYVGAWNEPKNTFENYKKIKESGITHIFLGDTYAYVGTDDYLEILQWCRELDLKVIAQMNNVGNEAYYHEINFDYRGYEDVVEMINYWDEPFRERVDTTILDYFNLHKARYGSSIQFFVNHFPKWTEPWSTGEGLDWYEGDGRFGDEGYDAHIKNYADKIASKDLGRGIISVDIYPFMWNKNSNEYYMDPTWLNNNEVIANEAKRVGGETHFFIQLIGEEYGHISTERYREVSAADIKMQVGVNLAYGAKGLSYFTYRKMVDPKEGELSIYNDVLKVNAELASFGYIYLDFDWEGVILEEGKNNPQSLNPLFAETISIQPKAERINYLHATEDLIVGTFTNETDEAFMFVNFTDPILELTNNVTVGFNYATKAMVFSNGEKKVVDLIDGKLEMILMPGEYAFIIPVNLKGGKNEN